MFTFQNYHYHLTINGKHLPCGQFLPGHVLKHRFMLIILLFLHLNTLMIVYI